MDEELEPRVVVASPKKQVVSPQVAPKSIPKAPKHVGESETIASRVKACRAQQNQPPNLTIAERVARRQRKAANTVLDHDTGELLEYRQLLRHPKHKAIWKKSAADEFGRLAQGIGGRVEGTNTIEFIHKHEVPQDRFKDVTYIKFVCTIRTEKKDPYRTRATMGGNLINYPDEA